MTKRVLVAMSGGVDSSLTAALLTEQGYAVEGVTMKLSPGVCCDIASAQAVSDHLKIPHHVLDAQESFSKDVIENFIFEYRLGRTPNPCIRCNDLVKFHLLLEYAIKNGFDYLATGHYARVERDEKTGRFLLKKGSDEGKDQSYFLYRLTQEQAGRVLFPLGGYRKTDVRKRAKELDLPAAERPESQEICFVPDNRYRAFLKENAPEAVRPGEIVSTDGRVLGKHDGIAFFTVGQRRKLGVAAGSRLYVVRIEPETNRVVLGKHEDLMTNEAFVTDVNLVALGQLRSALHVTVKVRYRSPYIPASLEPTSQGRIRVSFDNLVPGVCPGQAAVFYDGDVVVGGGVIEG